MEFISYLNDLCISEDIKIKNKIKIIREEIANAIISSKVNKAFDIDVTLSFGVIHINPYGSITEISFNGIDVTNIDQFVIEQALKVKKDKKVNYY